MRDTSRLTLLVLLVVSCARTVPGSAKDTVRLATYNIQELTSAKLDSVDARGRGAHPQLIAAAAVIRAMRPDVLVLNEVDVAQGEGSPDLARSVRHFQERYLEAEDEPLRYPHVFVAPVNTGVLTGMDLNRDGVTGTLSDLGTRTYGDDGFGFGTYPGQYGMAVLSRLPLDTAAARTFQRFLWKDLPGNHLPEAFYGDSAVAILRLSSKSHWDVPVVLDGDGAKLHLFVSHPTPPVFDGPEDRNGRRNFDEIGFWARYVDGSPALYDDRGRRGGHAGGPFAIMGDLNAEPAGGEARLGDTTAISQLLSHPRVQDPAPHRGRPTAEFGGGLRVDYVLPSTDVEVLDGGLWWPDAGEDPEAAALADAASDHHLVWLDVRVRAR